MRERKTTTRGVANVPQVLKRVAPVTQIRVTAKDNDYASRNDSSHCAIASAIQRSLHATFISVDRQAIRFTRNGFRYAYMTPPIAREAIMAFDSGGRAKPFTLRLNVGVMAPSGWKATHAQSTDDRAAYQRKYRTRLKQRKAAKARYSRVAVARTRIDGFKATTTRSVSN